MYDNLSGDDLDRTDIYDFHMNDLDQDVPLINRPFPGRMVQAGENYIAGIKLNYGAVYNAGTLADSDHEYAVPIPMDPYTYTDKANHGLISRKRQR